MVYLIHFEKPYKHAQHYIGYTSDLEQRIYEHELGCKGARLLQVVRDAGINFNVVRTWPDGDRTFERSLKNRKKARCLCPICCAERSYIMKNGKNPTRAQMSFIESKNLNPKNWLVCKDTSDVMEIVKRGTNKIRQLKKDSRVLKGGMLCGF